jgi:hypothetical protein
MSKSRIEQAFEKWSRINVFPSFGSSGKPTLTFDQFRAAVKDYEESKWIEVEKGFPPRSENVLLRRRKPFHTYALTGFQRDEIFYSNETGDTLEGVTHWLSLSSILGENKQGE